MAVPLIVYHPGFHVKTSISLNGLNETGCAPRWRMLMACCGRRLKTSIAERVMFSMWRECQSRQMCIEATKWPDR